MFLKRISLFIILLTISSQISAVKNFELSPEYQQIVLSRYNRLKDHYFFDLMRRKYDSLSAFIVALGIAVPALSYITKKIYDKCITKNKEGALSTLKKIGYFAGIGFSSLLTFCALMWGLGNFEDYFRTKEFQEITKLELIHMMKKIHGKFYIKI